ncbi:fibronectin type III domain-containing protein [Marinobacter sp. OP 3.4]|uniref:fibronectin type III domain-containing protein n=1 Tax=Marinobacter sp. OP 3.4 TaxID=3076501 RepID=UPI002E214986
MALQEERRILSWSLAALFSLVLAGCGGDSGTSSAAEPADAGTQTASEKDHTQDSGTARNQQDQTDAGSNQSDKAVADEGNAPPQIAQPGVVVENPIFADPIPVPVPDDAETDNADGGNGLQPEEPATDDDPEVAEPEPEPEEPDPVAQRPTLQWDGPLTREDGSKLYPGEIRGYRVYYRLRHQDEFDSLVVEGPDANSLLLDDFKPGAYEFAVSTLDSNGLESQRSEPVPVDLI